MNNYYMIPNSKDVSLFKEELILPLESYSIGFDVYFNYEEIKEISKKREVSVIINRLLHKKDLDLLLSFISKMDFVHYFFVEDLGLLNILDREKVVLFQNHILCNYDSVNYYYDMGVKNVVVSNELVLEELETIREKTKSNLFYFLINKNTLMYSRRKLISAYNDYKGIKESKVNTIIERVSRDKLLIKEEESGTVILDSKVFSANKEISKLSGFSFIINFSNLSSFESEMVMNHYKDENLCDFLDVDNYFLYNKIGYKVGDL